MEKNPQKIKDVISGTGKAAPLCLGKQNNPSFTRLIKTTTGNLI